MENLFVVSFFQKINYLASYIFLDFHGKIKIVVWPQDVF